MIQKGGECLRIPTTQYGSRALLQRMAKKSAMILKIQMELAVQGRTFEQTSVGIKVAEGLQRPREDLEREWKARKEGLRAETIEKEGQKERNKEAWQQAFERRLQGDAAETRRLQMELEQAHEERRRREELLQNVQAKMQREEAEMAERLPQEKNQQQINLRWRKRESFREGNMRTQVLLQSEKTNGKVNCDFHPVCCPYTTVCDNCFQNLGGAEFYST
ncbi:hypothetical protein GP486_002104 [Trichoglossum hirsutum]|uniref:Uncharacterized protein n=1 Tax=Trichoglossum hirsutum TaxID=265104 RepID=A0A9P8LFQ1_9PEZI|nr:hypothetical protein GP486_002104 [Trichoglossum hirsutum]